MNLEKKRNCVEKKEISVQKSKVNCIVDATSSEKISSDKRPLAIGDYVIVVYEEEYFPA